MHKSSGAYIVTRSSPINRYFWRKINTIPNNSRLALEQKIIISINFFDCFLKTAYRKMRFNSVENISLRESFFAKLLFVRSLDKAITMSKFFIFFVWRSKLTIKNFLISLENIFIKSNIKVSILNRQVSNQKQFISWTVRK